MARSSRHLWFALLNGSRIFGTIGLVALAGSVLTGSSCSVEACDDDGDDDDGDDDDWDDDDDDYCDDDDDSGSSSSTSTQAGNADGAIDWKLQEFGLVPAVEPGAHAVQSLIDIRGFSLRSKLGPGVYGDAEIQCFTGQVLQANFELLAPPAEHGRLRFDSIDHQEAFILVTYVQELVRESEGEGGDLPADGATTDVATLVPGAELVFVLDLHGRLLEIDSTLRTDAGAPDK